MRQINFFLANLILLIFVWETKIAQTIDIQGHRGFRGLMPENTIPAFVKALEYNVTTLELDLAVSKDSQLVVSHEPWLSETICITEKDKKAVIYRMTYKEIASFDCGSKVNPRFPGQQKMKVSKPLVNDVIDTIERITSEKKMKPLFYNIEMKQKPEWDGVYSPTPEVFAKLVVDFISKKKIGERVIIQSFDPRSLQAIHNIAPEIKTALLSLNKKGLRNDLKKLSFTPTIYSPNYRFVNRGFVKKAHAKNIKVIPWTVNKKTAMRKMIRRKVDGIITDYPNLLSEVLREN